MPLELTEFNFTAYQSWCWLYQIHAESKKIFASPQHKDNWNKIRKQLAIQEPQVCSSPLSNLYDREKSNCWLKLVPKEKENMDCNPVNLSSSWGSLGGGEKLLQRWVRSQAGWSRFLRWLEGDKGTSSVWMPQDQRNKSGLFCIPLTAHHCIVMCFPAQCSLQMIVAF